MIPLVPLIQTRISTAEKEEGCPVRNPGHLDVFISVSNLSRTLLQKDFRGIFFLTEGPVRSNRDLPENYCLGR
jgi:hypothetical protein